MFDKDIVAIDAIDYRGIGAEVQFREDIFTREIVKAYAGFSGGDSTSPVATGTSSLLAPLSLFAFSKCDCGRQLGLWRLPR